MQRLREHPCASRSFGHEVKLQLEYSIISRQDNLSVLGIQRIYLNVYFIGKCGRVCRRVLYFVE